VCSGTALALTIIQGKYTLAYKKTAVRYAVPKKVLKSSGLYDIRTGSKLHEESKDMRKMGNNLYSVFVNF
jgi:hypothetical protein